MPTLARPDVDVLEGLTTAIIVDQERMGGNPRSTVGTATDANAMLRILFSRLGQPHIGSPQAFSFNVAVGPRRRRDHGREGGGEGREDGRSRVTGGMCPRCEGMGTVSDIDLTELFDETQVARRGRDHRPGLHRGRLELSPLRVLRLRRSRPSRSATTPSRSATTSSTGSRSG